MMKLLLCPCVVIRHYHISLVEILKKSPTSLCRIFMVLAVRLVLCIAPCATARPCLFHPIVGVRLC